MRHKCGLVQDVETGDRSTKINAHNFAAKASTTKKDHDATGVIMVPSHKINKVQWAVVPDETSCRIIRAFFVTG